MIEMSIITGKLNFYFQSFLHMVGSLKLSACVAVMFYGVDPTAGVLFVPHVLAMVYFALVTFKVWRLNPEHRKGE